MTVWIGAIVLGYLLGSIPTGLLITRWQRGIDVRQVGSGRTGGTNVIRAAGWAAGVITALVDGLKAMLSIGIARWLDSPPLALTLAGIAAVAGHNYSIFLGFRGGAGTATSIGGAIALWPWNGAILIPVGVAAVGISRHASIGSIAVALVLPLIFAVRSALGLNRIEYVLYGVLTSGLTLWALRPNIRRLVRGEERSVKLKKEGE